MLGVEVDVRDEVDFFTVFFLFPKEGDESLVHFQIAVFEFEFFVDELVYEELFLVFRKLDSMFLADASEDHPKDLFDMGFTVELLLLFAFIDDGSCILPKAIKGLGIDTVLEDWFEDLCGFCSMLQKLEVFRIDLAHEQGVEDIDRDGLGLVDSDQSFDPCMIEKHLEKPLVYEKNAFLS